MKKRTVALLLALITLAAALAGCGQTDAPESYSEGLEFKLNNSGTGYVVSGIGTCKDTKIIIPPTYEDLPVTGITSSAFEDCTSLTSITIPGSVTHIGEGALYMCTSLTSVKFGGTVAEWRKAAVYEGQAAGVNCEIKCTDGTLTLIFP